MFNNLRTIQLQSSNDNIGAGLRNPGPLRQPIPRQGLVGEWLLNGNAGDSSGYGNNGTATNVTYSDTDVGYYRQNGVFNGSNAYITIPTLLPTTYSICLWINTSSSASTSRIMMNSNFSLTINYPTNGYIEFGDWVDQTIISNSNSYNNGNWNFITLVCNNGVSNGSFIYKNGIVDGIGTISTSQSTGLTYIGTRNSLAQFYNGGMNIIRIYNRVISLKEIQTLYKEGLKLLH